MPKGLLDLAEIGRQITEEGAEFRGMQEGPCGRLVLFDDPLSRTTLALAESDFSVEALRRRLLKSRERSLFEAPLG